MMCNKLSVGESYAGRKISSEALKSLQKILKNFFYFSFSFYLFLSLHA